MNQDLCSTNWQFLPFFSGRRLMPKTRFLSTYRSELIWRIGTDIVERTGSLKDESPRRGEAELVVAMTSSNSTVPSNAVSPRLNPLRGLFAGPRQGPATPPMHKKLRGSFDWTIWKAVLMRRRMGCHRHGICVPTVMRFSVSGLLHLIFGVQIHDPPLLRPLTVGAGTIGNLRPCEFVSETPQPPSGLRQNLDSVAC